MEYQIKIRRLTSEDLGRGCQFPNTDKESYTEHVAALLDDLKSIETVDVVNEMKGVISIHSKLDNEDDFWNSVKLLFEREKEYIKFEFAKRLA